MRAQVVGDLGVAWEHAQGSHDVKEGTSPRNSGGSC
jgi:hypothetical protein